MSSKQPQPLATMTILYRPRVHRRYDPLPWSSSSDLGVGSYISIIHLVTVVYTCILYYNIHYIFARAKHQKHWQKYKSEVGVINPFDTHSCGLGE